MNGAERYTLIKNVFLAASKLPKGERTGYLNAQCEGDPGLAGEVRALLNAEEREPAFLETPALEADGLAPGSRLGAFRIERLLGEGGMGVVYEAQQDEPSRRVALKIIRPGFLSARLRARFRHEIRTLGQLRHPGIAQIYEAGTLAVGGEDVPYFAMELVEGKPLLEFTGGLGVRERLALVAQVCDAVHHAHQKGVVHRDLKPANILVEPAPTADSGASGTSLPFQIKILDFGIARVADTDVRTASMHTEPGQLVGTIPYMSPEQIAGRTEAIDIRTDVYSIGVIAFEVLAGRLPYPVRERLLPDAVRMIHDAEPTRLGSIDRSLRGDVETIIGKALEKEPGRRYQSAAELASDLRRHLRDEPIVARPASALYQFRKFTRRNRTVVVAAGLIFAAMAAATAVSIWQTGVAVRARAFAEREQGRANRSAEAASREARRATLAATAAAIEAGNPMDARRVLEGTDESRRGWAWRYWHARLDDSIAKVPVGGRPAGAWISPDSSRIAAVMPDGRIVGGDPWSGPLGPVAALARTPVAAAAFTADGARIAAVCGPGQREVWEFDAATGSELRRIATLSGAGVFIEMSADGRAVSVAMKTLSGSPPADRVMLWTGDGGEHDIRPSGRTSGIAMSADGRFVATGFDGMAGVDTREPGARWTVEHDRVWLAFAMTGDGMRIASGGEDKLVRIWERGRSEPLLTLRGHAGDITALAFDPAGGVVASAATDRSIRLWDARTGRALATLSGHTGRIRSLRFAADGRRFMSLSDDGTIRVWRTDPQDPTTVLTGHTSYVYAAVFTPDGSRIVSGAWDRTIRVWDAAGGEPLKVFDAGPDVVTTVAVTPDGRAIAAGHKVGDWDTAHLILRDIETGEERWRTPLGRGQPHDLAFDRAGRRVWAAWEHGGVGVVELTGGAPATETLVSRRNRYAVALSPDERVIAHGGAGGIVSLSDAASGETIRQWTGHSGTVTALAFCPVRGVLASGSMDGTIRIWDAGSGAEVARLDRHWGPVYCLAFSPDGECLASGSDDTTIRIWDIEAAEELTQLRGHSAYIYSLVFSPDGSRLVSGSGDSTVRVWDTRPVHERWTARGGRGAQ